MHSADSIFIVLTDANGKQGVGECAPFPSLTGDTVQTAFPALNALRSSIQGKEVNAALHLLLSKLRKEYSTAPSALTGLEMALWDLKAKQSHVSLAGLWGCSIQQTAETDITLPIMEKSSLAGFWKLYSNHGFRIIKVKVGGNSARTDAERIFELYSSIPEKTLLTLDGNQGCTVASALELVEILGRKNLKPLFFEQPLPQDDWKGMSELTKCSPIPICADETVKTSADALRVIQEKAAHLINLKFMKSGVFETLRIVHVAKAAGMDLMIGGMLETEVAMSASLHLVCGTGDIRWCDLDTPFFLKAHVTEASPYHAQKAELTLPQGQGLGLTLSQSALFEYRDPTFSRDE
jgi:o-succinylbenzoate synthase